MPTVGEEITVSISINMEKNNFDPPEHSVSFSTAIDNDGLGPTPGAMTVDATGNNVDLSELTIGGIVFIENYEDDGGSVAEWGLWDVSDGTFEPIGEVRPGESWPFRLSRYLGREYAAGGTGEGTSGAPDSHLRVRAQTGTTCRVGVKAYNK